MTGSERKRVLVVEDEPLIAMVLEDMLSDLGATVIGPAATINEGLEFATRGDMDFAILDVNVGGKSIEPVAELLRQRGIPFAFATGSGDGLGGLYSDAPVIQKPYTSNDIAVQLGLFSAG